MTNESPSRDIPPAPAKMPETAEGRRAMEQARDAIDNTSQGYGGEPSASPSNLDAPATPQNTASPATSATPERLESPAEGGTEPTHVPVRGADRR